MMREEYLAQLRGALAQRMPPQELESVMNYYEEYFNEAGPAGEARVVEELGPPEKLARIILGDKALEALERPENTAYEAPPRKRRGLSTLWTVLLAVCAAPVAIPLIILAVAFVVLLVVVVVVAVVGVAAAGVACVGAGLFAAFRGFSVLFSAGLTTTMFFSGVGLLTMGVGVLLITGIFALAGLCFKGVAKLLGRLLRRKEARA